MYANYSIRSTSGVDDAGGELFERIVEKERYSEREAREIVRQLTKAIAFAHSKGACQPANTLWLGEP